MPISGMRPTYAAAGTNNIPNRLSSFRPSTTARACSHPCTRLNTLPAKMTRPKMNGKVPDSTPAADQPMPLSRLDTTTAAPNAPVSSAVPASRPRPETIIATLVGDQPTFIRGNFTSAFGILGDELAEGIAGKERIGLRGPLDVFLPFRRALNFLHQIDIKRRLIRRHLARQPDRAGLLELRDVEAGLNAGRNIVPVLGLRDLRTVGKSLRAEGAKRALGAALPLPNAFAGIVDVGVDMAAGQLHGRFGAALEGNVGERHLRRLVDHAGKRFIGVL